MPDDSEYSAAAKFVGIFYKQKLRHHLRRKLPENDRAAAQTFLERTQTLIDCCELIERGQSDDRRLAFVHQVTPIVCKCVIPMLPYQGRTMFYRVKAHIKIVSPELADTIGPFLGDQK